MIELLKKVYDRIFNAAGREVGELEKAFPAVVRYPVREYQAEVDAGKLWRGSRPDLVDLKELAGCGFKTVVNLCAEQDWENTPGSSLGMFMVWIPVIDNTPPTEEEVIEFLSVVRDMENQPAYVHCEAGIGRTGCFCAAYRVLAQGWTPEMALTEARGYGLAIPSQIDFIQNLKGVRA